MIKIFDILSNTEFLFLIYFIGLIIIIAILGVILSVFIVQREKTKRIKILASALSRNKIKKKLNKQLKNNNIIENETNIINIAERLYEIKKR